MDILIPSLMPTPFSGEDGLGGIFRVESESSKHNAGEKHFESNYHFASFENGASDIQQRSPIIGSQYWLACHLATYLCLDTCDVSTLLLVDIHRKLFVSF